MWRTAQGLLAAERETAIRDLLADNSFEPAGRAAGRFRLRLSVREDKLVLDVEDAEATPVIRHVLSLRPLERVVKDYFLICESHAQALRSGHRDRIEAIDLGRRGIHNEGAETLRERLAGKIDIDFQTARRLFTLVCALSGRGPVAGSG